MRTRSVIPAAVLLCGCGLRHRAVAPEPARDPVRDSVFRLDETRGDSLLARGPVDGMLALLSSDVIYLRAGVPAVYGRDAARALFAAGSSGPASNEAWQPLGGGVSNDLRSGYTYGVVARVSAPTSPIHFERYIAYWRREAAQPWRIAAYAEVGSPPAMPEVSVSADQLTAPLRELPKPLSEARAELRAADSSFADLAYRMGSAYAFSNTVVANGVVFAGPQLVIGPDAIRALYAAHQSTSSLAWHPVYAAIAESKDLGFTIGEYVATGLGASGAAVQRTGKYLTVWIRQRDGTWKFVVDGGNSTPSRESQR
jgi:ketosteroid isomerase-like protein